jgi:hypothetical protein
MECRWSGEGSGVGLVRWHVCVEQVGWWSGEKMIGWCVELVGWWSGEKMIGWCVELVGWCSGDRSCDES